MVRKLLLNIWLGVLAFLITFVTALGNNVVSVSLTRAVCAFILFFLAAFVIRFLLALILAPDAKPAETGAHVDLVTPPDPKTDVPKSSENEPSDGFQPLVPPRIERNERTQDPADIANIIRRLTDE